MLFLNYPSGWKCQQLQGGIGPGRKAVCVFMSALPRAKGSRIHNSTAGCLSPATAIADIGERPMMKWHRGWVRNLPLFFPLAAHGTHLTSAMRTTLLEMIFRQKKEKKKREQNVPHPVNSCRGCPVGTRGVSQVNLMKNSAVIGRWMPWLTKARLTEGSGVKIALAFASGPPLARLAGYYKLPNLYLQQQIDSNCSKWGSGPGWKKCAVQLAGSFFGLAFLWKHQGQGLKVKRGMRTKGEDGGINAQMSRSNLWVLCPCQM